MKKTYSQRINERFPDINPEKDENLNIEDMHRKYFSIFWENGYRVEDIASQFSISERKVYAMRIRFGLKLRNTKN